MKHCAAVEPDQQFDFEKKCDRDRSKLPCSAESPARRDRPKTNHNTMKTVVYQISHNKETFMCKMWVQLPDGSTHALPISQTVYQRIKQHFPHTTSDGENVYRIAENGTDSNTKA